MSFWKTQFDAQLCLWLNPVTLGKSLPLWPWVSSLQNGSNGAYATSWWGSDCAFTRDILGRGEWDPRLHLLRGGSLLLIVTRAPLGLMPASNVTKPRNTISKMLSKVRVHGKWSANSKGWLQLQITENTLTKLQVLKDSGDQEVQSDLLLGSTLPWASSFFRPEARWQQCL